MKEVLNGKLILSQLRKRRRAGIQRIHYLELKYKRYITHFWYYFSPPYWVQSRINDDPPEDQTLMMFFKQFPSQQERAKLWRNQEFVEGFCKQYLKYFSNDNVNSHI